MKVQEIMTTDPATCGPDEAVMYAAAIMWHRDCGAVPVVDGKRRLVGIITDRDICIALASRNARPRGVKITDVMSGNLITCQANDSIADALKLMAEHQVRRLPVVSGEGILEGIVALSDLIAVAGKKTKRSERVSRKDILHAMHAITAQRHESRIKGESARSAAAGSEDTFQES
jgi:CBS domain-containing protein